MGSDVLEWSAGDEDIARRVWNRAEAPWLAQELEAGGLPDVELAPWTCVEMPDDLPGPPSRSLSSRTRLRLGSISTGSRSSSSWLDALGDVRFELLATTLKDGLPPNVRTLGWVEDMDSVFRRATVLIRPVMHDGLANMVIEALAYGRYVLWIYEMPWRRTDHNLGRRREVHQGVGRAEPCHHVSTEPLGSSNG